jgi:MFS family permease
MIAAFRQVFASADLRRMLVSTAVTYVAQWAWLAMLSVLAYERGGGAALAAIFVLRLVPGAVLNPVLSAMTGRHRRERVLVVLILVVAAVYAVAAVVTALEAPLALTFVLVSVEGLASTVLKPTRNAILPWLSVSPRDLAAANSVTALCEVGSVLVGPVFAGLVLRYGHPAAGLAALALLLVVNVALNDARLGGATPRDTSRARPREALRSVLGGLTAVARDRHLTVVLGLLTLSSATLGGLNVLLTAASISLLGMGRSGPPTFMAAIGLGGLIGGVAALAALGRRRLAHVYGAGLVLMGAPVVVIGLYPAVGSAVLLSIIGGVGYAAAIAAGTTFVHRLASHERLGSVLVMKSSLHAISSALGAAVAPPLIEALGERATLGLIGAALPVATALLGRRLGEADRAAVTLDHELAVLARVAIFAPLELPIRTRLASALRRAEIEPDATVLREGDPGEDFFIVGQGRFEVTIDEVPVRELGVGDHFGEIALLRNVPRSATVKALERGLLWRLGRDDFLEALTGNPAAARLAEEVTTERLRVTPIDPDATPPPRA